MSFAADANWNHGRPVARLTSAFAIVLAVALFGAFGGADAAGTVVRIKGFGYFPSPVTIYAGQTVTWVNDDAVDHWVIDLSDASPAFVASQTIKPGEKYSAVFSSAGTVRYTDALYPFMVGTVIVKAGPGPTPKPTAKPATTPKPTAKATAKPAATAKPTAKPAATAKPTPAPAASSTTAAAASVSPETSGPPEAGGTTTEPGESAGPGPASTTPGGSPDSGGGLGSVLALLGLAGLAFVGGIWFATSRRRSPPASLTGPYQSIPSRVATAVPVPTAAAIAPAPAPPATAPLGPPEGGRQVPGDVDEDAPLQAARPRTPNRDEADL